jgi:divalent metal cation (Fe/Co/Zn/Cd) transporter
MLRRSVGQTVRAGYSGTTYTLAPMSTGTVDLRRRGLRLEYLTVAWNVIEAVVAVWAGIAAGSIALVGFGLDSMIEVFAASVVIWEFKGASEQRQGRALRLIAISFFALAAYVTVEAVRDLIVGSEAAESVVGIVLAAISLAVMPVLAIAKRRTGRRLASATLLADATETLLCSYLSAILLVGLLLNATVDWWWADPLAALGIAYLAVREGLEAWRGEGDHHHDEPGRFGSSIETGSR